MRLFKKDTTNDYVMPKDLSVSAIGMLNSLLVRSNDKLENIDLYSLSNDSRKDVVLAFRELRKKKYIIYSSLDDIYYIYISPQKKLKKGGKSMNAEETLNLITKQWCTLEDIMKLGHLGRNSALKAKKKIKEKLEKQGYLIPKSVVPTKEVVAFFDIDIPYLESRVSSKELIKKM